jgi:lysophospholipase L1-like esterase
MFFDDTARDELQIGGYVNHASDIMGIDSPTECFFPDHYQNFNYNVDYVFNHLGYREPDNYTKNAIICIGDSFTVGLGLPVELTYPKRLQNMLDYPVLNFSLNGASNEWITRKLNIILKYFDPAAIVVHYTFSHRRELPDQMWFDDERTMCDEHRYTEEENYQNWLGCYTQIAKLPHNIVHSFIPDWHTKNCYPTGSVKPNRVDFARDGFHYGVESADLLAKELASKISMMGALVPKS